MLPKASPGPADRHIGQAAALTAGCLIGVNCAGLWVVDRRA